MLLLRRHKYRALTPLLVRQRGVGYAMSVDGTAIIIELAP